VEISEEINMLQKSLTKTLAGFRVLFPGPAHDLCEIG